jgi:pyridinium-3,5-biscarboxylic acid mononucleotide synthase
MNRDSATELAQRFLNGDLPLDALRAAFAGEQVADLADATVDLDRQRRCGYPEVIYAPGKPVDSLLRIVAELIVRDQDVLVTRLEPVQAEALVASFPDGAWNQRARTFRRMAASHRPTLGQVAVITAGTSDLPVADEACETARWMRVEVVEISDVGVAGPHRLPRRLPEFAHADAIVVVAGMEGALPSVVGGFVDCPVIAVPTSVGYGANFGGVAALLSMLNSCAATPTQSASAVQNG